MEKEHGALLQNHIWDLVPCLARVNVVSGKWVFCHKFKADGSLDRYKARWVLRSFTQCPGIDYDETFNLVVKLTAVQTILSLALSCGLPIHQLDIKNAFLHDTFSEQPSCFEDTSHPKLVCCLNKSLYELKQAPRAPVQDTMDFLSLASALQYLIFTRPDISYAIQQISLHMHDPQEPHLAVLKRILWYIRSTLDFGPLPATILLGP
ncbi:hypothetical protein U9M48_035863 [Paspalum notatum var. saurae]|uniref:Reverse transcriptase Ty1/copia-type domain-containing protein n=1 Tax=Paspalum notatum var. saurae TaxID=547442 RepID=A0AAQ3UCE4_PASNO